MAQLSTKIKLYCNANGVSDIDFTKDIILQDDNNGNGPYIKEWNIKIKEPTKAELKSHENNANTIESNIEIDRIRKNEFGSWEKQLDQIYHDMDGWKKRIKAVKDKFPKP
jgi:hypothetical protein